MKLSSLFKCFFFYLGFATFIFVFLSFYYTNARKYNLGFSKVTIIDHKIDNAHRTITLTVGIATPEVKQDLYISSNTYECIFFEGFRERSEQYAIKKGKRNVIKLKGGDPHQFDIKGFYYFKNKELIIDLGKYGRKTIPSQTDIDFRILFIPYKLGFMDSLEYYSQSHYTINFQEIKGSS